MKVTHFLIKACKTHVSQTGWVCSVTGALLSLSIVSHLLPHQCQNLLHPRMRASGQGQWYTVWHTHNKQHLLVSLACLVALDFCVKNKKVKINELLLKVWRGHNEVFILQITHWTYRSKIISRFNISHNPATSSDDDCAGHVNPFFTSWEHACFLG